MTLRSVFMGSIAALLILNTGCAAQTSTSSSPNRTTVYVVRHAEKLDTSSDTPLSSVGEERATALADRLGDANVQRIYATTLLRTQQTVDVLAKRLDLVPALVEPEAIVELVARIKAEDRGKVVLVAGHSNTVPAIVQGLSGKTIDAIPESQFDRLYRVVIEENGSAEVEVLQYGAATP